MPTTSEDALITAFFGVTIDGHNLGDWTYVDLGGCEVEVEQFSEGGNNFFTYQLPGRIRFRPIVLSRLCGSDSSAVAGWISQNGTKVSHSTGEITAYDKAGKPCMRWQFSGGVPVRWTLPTLHAGASEAAFESLEIAHQGFTA